MLAAVGVIGTSCQHEGAPDVIHPEPVPRAEVQPVSIVYGDHPNNRATLRVPEGSGPAPVAVLIHGGFWAEPWNISLMTNMAEDLHDHGVATWNIEYRRTGGAGGWPQTGDDVHHAIEHLASISSDYALDLERVVLVGHSAGGHLALWAIEEQATRGGTVRPLAAIGLAAVTDLDAFANRAEPLLGGVRSENPTTWDDAQPDFVEPDRIVLIHGEGDDVVPLDTLANAQAAGVQPIVIEDLSHMGIIEPSDPAWPQIRASILGALDVG